MKKSEFCEIFSRNLWQKTHWKYPIIFFVFKRKINNIFLKFYWILSKLAKLLSKFPKKGEWNQRNSLYFLKSLNLNISLSKTKVKKSF